MDNVRKLGKDWFFFWSVYYFYEKDNAQCLENIKKLFDTFYKQFQEEQSANDSFLDEALFISMFTLLVSGRHELMFTILAASLAAL